MNKLLFLLVVVFALLSCKTNPPTEPISLKTGEVRLEITVSDDNSISDNRTVLLEDFANVSCVPCVTSNKIIRSVLNNYGSSKVVSIKFPTNFPSPVDPFYLSAKQFCDYRMTYYNIILAPTIIFDGLIKPTASDSNSVKNSLDSRLSVPSNFKIDITKTINNGGLLLNVEIKIKDRNSLNLDELFIRTALIESEIEFTTPPGSNGETKFYDVLRTLLPDNGGMPFSSLNSSNSIQYDDVIDTVWNIDKLEAVIFIQNASTKEIYQAGSTF